MAKTPKVPNLCKLFSKHWTVGKKCEKNVINEMEERIMNQTPETFGERVRRKRMEKQITLRKFADMIEVSPTYVSQIERNELDPPSESKVAAIAKILNEDVDELLALANRIPSDIPAIIQQHPLEVTMFLRTAKDFSREDWKNLTTKTIKHMNKKEGDDQ